ncbi:MAG: hypothetical protein NVS9B15_08650 [Acidobacteriaceae bacterium]
MPAIDGDGEWVERSVLHQPEGEHSGPCKRQGAESQPTIKIIGLTNTCPKGKGNSGNAEA